MPKAINKFRKLANKSLEIFTVGGQKIVSYTELRDSLDIEINYHATLAVDLPN